MLMTGKVRPTRRPAPFRPGTRPTLDALELRQLLAVSPVLQGTVFNDANRNGALDTTEAPLANATINLYAANATTPLATTRSGPDGGYVFDSTNVTGGLTPGATYTLTESLAGYTNTGAQALSQIDPAKVTAPNAIQVTVVDPTKVTASFTSIANNPFNGVYYSYNGATGGTVPTQGNFALAGDPNLTSTTLTSLCVGLRDDLSYNKVFPTILDPQSALNNGGRIAYLYNHYSAGLAPDGSNLPASIQGLSLKNVSAGLQLAIWELEYNNGVTLTGYNPAYTSAQDYSDLQTATSVFLNDSLGKSEKVIALDASLTGNLPAPTVTPGGQSILASMSFNFGNQVIPPGNVTGFVYSDANNNGSKDGGDGAIGGVLVSLVNPATGAVVATTTSNPDGSYSFNGITPGTYTVVEGKASGYLPSSTNSGVISGVSVTSGATSANNNFGQIVPATITGFVYADANTSGARDSGDAGLGGVPVRLVNPATGATVAMTTTNPDGSYTFSGLYPGTYTVVETKQPSGYLPSATNAGSLSGVAVAQGATSSNNNFGEVQPGAISGFVYSDANNNGVRDNGDGAIGGVLVSLVNPTTGAVVATTTSNPDGSYQFTNLPPGVYTVVEGKASGYLPSSTNSGSLAKIGVTQGATNPNNNFGQILPASIAGVVYQDKTGDGLSGDDSALSGVTVQLLAANGTVLATQKVGADGSYLFGNLVPGTYTVREITPSGYVQTAPNALIYVVPLSVGQNVVAQNFDNYQVNCGCCPISNVSYTVVGPCGISTVSSLGGNTDQGDQVTVNFTVGGTTPMTITLVTYTATSNFDLTKQTIFSVDTQTFGPGAHSLTVTIPNSYYQIDFVCGGAISQFNPSANITYHGEGRFIDADRGGSEAAPAAFASLSGLVFVDNNYDGNFNSSDTGLGGVTVRLTGKDINGQVVSLTRLTNKDGSYNFSGLQPGTYAVREVTPGGYFTTKNSVGQVNGTAVGSLTGPDTIGGITLTGGSSAVSYNFGEQATGSALGCNQTASVGFWASCSGQNLIRSLNGGVNSTALGNWLAATCPNTLSGLAGKTNAQVAAYFQSSYNNCRYSPLTEGLATALAIYATDAGLAGGNYASCYGLKVTAAGAGAATINVGTTFACYGGPQGCITLVQLLQYADASASCSDAWFWYRLACVLDNVNSAGTY